MAGSPRGSHRGAPRGVTRGAPRGGAPRGAPPRGAPPRGAPPRGNATPPQRGSMAARGSAPISTPIASPSKPPLVVASPTAAPPAQSAAQAQPKDEVPAGGGNIRKITIQYLQFKTNLLTKKKIIQNYQNKQK